MLGVVPVAVWMTRALNAPQMAGTNVLTHMKTPSTCFTAHASITITPCVLMLEPRPTNLRAKESTQSIAMTNQLKR